MSVRCLDEYYRQNPLKKGHVDIIFEPKFARKYVHFNEVIFYENHWLTIDRGGSGWLGNLTHSLDQHAAVKYILAEDKKVFRKCDGGWFSDAGLLKRDFHHRLTSVNLLPTLPPPLAPLSPLQYKPTRVLLTCEESEIDLLAEIPCLYVNRVAVWRAPYLCPTTGILWDYQNDSERGAAFSDRFWLFKQLPKTRLVMREAGGLAVKRNVEIQTLRDDSDAYDPEIFSTKSKTAFLSGEKVIRKRLKNWRSSIGKDSREFLSKRPKTPKFTIVRSAARYLRKRLKISPLQPAEKRFFQMMGALAHINNETLNRKKAYAA